MEADPTEVGAETLYYAQADTQKSQSHAYIQKECLYFHLTFLMHLFLTIRMVFSVFVPKQEDAHQQMRRYKKCIY